MTARTSVRKDVIFAPHILQPAVHLSALQSTSFESNPCASVKLNLVWPNGANSGEDGIWSKSLLPHTEQRKIYSSINTIKKKNRKKKIVSAYLL